MGWCLNDASRLRNPREHSRLCASSWGGSVDEQTRSGSFLLHHSRIDFSGIVSMVIVFSYQGHSFQSVRYFGEVYVCV